MRTGWIIVVALAVQACRSDAAMTSATGQESLAVFDTAPIELDNFVTDANLQRRILRMPVGEAAARLGSFHFEARSHFVFSRGGEEHEQNDIYTLHQDALGNYHLVLDTPHSQLELYRVGETVYVRHDKGSLRNKPRRDLEAGDWRELAFASVRQTLDVFAPRIKLSQGKRDKVDGRQAMRYNVSLGEDGSGLAAGLLRSATLPVPAPARWRELASPLDLRGAIWLDTATGVLSRTQIEGRLEVADRAVRPTQLTLRFDSAVTDAGDVAPVRPPASVPEFERKRRERDPLDFFRDQLDQQAAKGKKK